MKQSRIRGFTTIEVAVVVALAAIVTSVTMPQLSRLARHAKLRSAVREVYSLVLATRMQAVKRDAQVIMFVDLNKRSIKTWADKTPYNYAQDANEPTINTYSIPQSVYIQSVSFDTYEGNKKLVDLIVFRNDGTLVAPQSKTSRLARRPTPYTTNVPPGSVDCKKDCRGIYISDKADSGDEDRTSSGSASTTSAPPATHPS